MSGLGPIDGFSPERQSELALAEIGRRWEVQEASRPRRPVLPIEPEAPFLPTSVATRLFSVVDRCICMRGNGLILGAPGIGKTVAITEAMRRSDTMEGPEVAVLKVEPAYGQSAMVLLDELAPLLGVEAARSVADTVRRLKRDVYFRPLVIFDEAQNLSLRIVHQLLSISEDTGVRMLFVGNPEAVKLVNSGIADVRLISRRLAHRDEIMAITDEDADLIAGYFGVEEMDGFRLCRRIGMAFHADGIVQVLRDARFRRGGAGTIRPPEIEASIDSFAHIRAGLARPASLRAIPVRQNTAGRARLAPPRKSI